LTAQRAGSWLFLIGSLAFTGDAALGLADGATTREILYAAGCVLFVVGCGFFVRASREP
jgi:hypothetical protein